jgi:Protein of unknown function (DUF4197)
VRVPGLQVLVLCAIAGTAWPANNQQLLEQAANHAIDSLGRPDGYFGNPEVRIPLPGKLEKLHKVLQTLGASKEVDALVLAMNRAAEAALPECRALIAASIRDMPPVEVEPAGELVQKYRTAMSDRLTTDMLPAVSKATRDVHVAKTYNDVAAKASALGILDQRDADLDAYVTRKTLDGLFKTMSKEEAERAKK